MKKFVKYFFAIIGIIVAFVVFLIVTDIGQGILDFIIPRFAQYVIMFLVALYWVVRTAVQDGRR